MGRALEKNVTDEDLLQVAVSSEVWVAGGDIDTDSICDQKTFQGRRPLTWWHRASYAFTREKVLDGGRLCRSRVKSDIDERGFFVFKSEAEADEYGVIMQTSFAIPAGEKPNKDGHLIDADDEDYVHFSEARTEVDKNTMSRHDPGYREAAGSMG